MPADIDHSLNKTTLAAIISILIMTSLLYFNGLTPSFSADDDVHLDKNKNFDTLWETREVFLHLDGREYRPLVRVSLWLNSKMGKTALPFHITNILLHLACIVSLYFLFFKLSGSRGAALVGCALFALHPIHTTNRLIVLSLLWFLITLLPISGGNAHCWYLYMPSASLCLFVVAIQGQKFTGLHKRIFSVLIGIASVCYAVEVYRQSEIWSRQSSISADFLEQAGTLGLNDLDAFYFINMPFGYKSAFQFIFNSFENALSIRN